MNKLNWGDASFSLTDLAVISMLRFVSGLGLGLLLAESLPARDRRRLGWSLFGGSIAVGVPLGIRMLRGDKEAESYFHEQQNNRAQPFTNQAVG
ncbi:MAG TPA: hypothetical protein VFY40_14010 [Blastocatellia bacterium]|nr:hypothetical protein [Blastocatellia bacterium]